MIAPSIGNFLNQLYTDYQSEYMDRDPIEFLHAYENPLDQEVVGFLSAALAIGRVELFRKALHKIFDIMGSSPYQYVVDFNPSVQKGNYKGFVYRFYKGEDITLLIWWLHQIYQENNTLEDFFLKGFHPYDESIETALSLFVNSILSLPTRPIRGETPAKGSGIRHFLADPQDNSACKRLNLFLRWMVRHDQLDLGIWKHVSPSQLIIPLDTHIARLSRCLGLSQRKSPGWSMALEITQTLKQLDPEDPVKFDFALCTVGKLNACPNHPSTVHCASCPLAPHCLNLSRT